MMEVTYVSFITIFNRASSTSHHDHEESVFHGSTSTISRHHDSSRRLGGLSAGFGKRLCATAVD